MQALRDVFDELKDLELVDRLEEVILRFRIQLGRVVVGQDRVVEELLLTLLAGGHAILEGVPGLAKTLIVQSLSCVLSLDYGRVQFTPDLMPSDVTGTLVVREDPVSGERSFVFQKGPIFVNLLLADEINRTPPKTQAALLEGMSETFVTVGGRRHFLPQPFFVLATQNPIEQEGTYPLPEAQLDRFLFKIVVDYPNAAEEYEVIRRTTGTETKTLAPVVSRAEILSLQRIVRALPVSHHVQEYATRLVRRSRPEDRTAPDWIREYVSWGAGPRAAQALILAAKARTLLGGRFSVTRGDIREVAFPVLRHRILPNFQAEAEGHSPEDLIARLLLETSFFSKDDRYDEVTRRLLRL
jgi:MoxR-like ATPase